MRHGLSLGLWASWAVFRLVGEGGVFVSGSIWGVVVRSGWAGGVAPGKGV